MDSLRFLPPALGAVGRKAAFGAHSSTVHSTMTRGGAKLWAQVTAAYPDAGAIVRERPPGGAKDWNDPLRAQSQREPGAEPPRAPRVYRPRPLNDAPGWAQTTIPWFLGHGALISVSTRVLAGYLIRAHELWTEPWTNPWTRGLCSL